MASPSPSSNTQVASGAALIFLGRLGALLDILSVFLFARLYGSATYGLFFVLWSAVQLLAIISDLGMTMALQRFVPSQQDDQSAGRVVKYALGIAFTTGSLIAILVCVFAPAIAPYINAASDDTEHLVNIIRIYAWAIPLWVLIDVSTAAIRARRVFGPEIRIRIFYEQAFRIVFGVGFFAVGLVSYGLFIAHLVGLAVTAFFALRLVDRHYGLVHILRRTGQAPDLIRDMLRFSLGMLIPNLARKVHSNIPVLFLNFLLPGANGAVAAGIYGVARKLVSALIVFRESFDYVLAPLAAHSKTLDDRQGLHDMYAFATRLSLCLLIPSAILIVGFREQLLWLSGPEFAAGSIVMIILTGGRIAEASFGPSSSIVAMLGHYALPLFNASFGILTTIILCLFLVPEFGLTGGAIAAAIGITAASLAAMLQVWLIYKLQPYDRSLLRPLVTSLLIATGYYGLIQYLPGIGPVGQIMTGVVMWAVSIILLARFGLSAQDVRVVIPPKVAARFPFLWPKRAKA